VYVSVIGDRHQARQSLDALTHASGFLRGELGHKIDLRHTPDLIFIEDRSTERAIEIAKTLREDAEKHRVAAEENAG
jgi:ribosome-binding factor A